MSVLNVRVKLLNSSARMPSKSHAGDAGWDLFCSKETVIAPGTTAVVPTGIAMEIPGGWYGQVKSRSGLGTRGVVVTAGVIDSGYRGEIGVVIVNSNGNSGTDGALRFSPGDKIAQMVFLPVPEVRFEQVDSLGDTSRGENGFGSTGTKG